VREINERSRPLHDGLHCGFGERSFDEIVLHVVQYQGGV
jgi:hypothetical protein